MTDTYSLSEIAVTTQQSGANNVLAGDEGGSPDDKDSRNENLDRQCSTEPESLLVIVRIKHNTTRAKCTFVSAEDRPPPVTRKKKRRESMVGQTQDTENQAAVDRSCFDSANEDDRSPILDEDVLFMRDCSRPQKGGSQQGGESWSSRSMKLDKV